MKIFFYGTRGSLPTPLLLEEYQDKMKQVLKLYKKSNIKDVDQFIQTLPFSLSHIYGGNTSCLSIEDDTREIMIVDAGSGLRVFGEKLAVKNNMVIHIFLSHSHWDHICGLPFFKPIYNPSNTIIFYSSDHNIIRNLIRQQHASHFPVPFSKLPAKKKFVILENRKNYEVNGFSILNIPVVHPGGCTSYIFKKNNKKISYATDAEFTPENMQENSHFYKACYESSDVLVMDSQYSLVEFFSKFDWGHTSSNMAVNLALEWRVKKLVLFHFDPAHKEDDLEVILEEAYKYKEEFNRRKLDIIQAIEGEFIQL